MRPEALDRRPLEPMPQEIENPHGDLAVHRPGARDRMSEPVLPGTRKERQLISGIEVLHQGAGKVMRVLAHARTLAQGGPVVENDLQTRRMVPQRRPANGDPAGDDKPFAINGLTAFFWLC